jgi:hypothetical protein
MRSIPSEIGLLTNLKVFEFGKFSCVDISCCFASENM